MKKQFAIFMILDTIIRYLLSFIVDKAWGKTGRPVPKDNGINNTLVEYIIYILITSLFTAIFARQLTILGAKFMEEKTENKEPSIDNYVN